jgi:hypothetical protein
MDQPIQQAQRMLADARSDQQRIREMPPEGGRLHTEIYGTLFNYLQEIIVVFVTAFAVLKDLWRLAAGMQEWADTTTDHLEALEERVGLLEDYGASTTILPDDFEVAQEVLEGGGMLIQRLLEGPFPIEAPDEEAKRLLLELAARYEALRKIMERGRIELEDLEDLEEDEEDEEEGEERGPDNVASSPGALS